jgi:hypothetical protein
LNVLLTKTVEQAMLEVEEETELFEIKKYKEECGKRKSNEHNDWEQEVKKEIARIKRIKPSIMPELKGNSKSRQCINFSVWAWEKISSKTLFSTQSNI